MSRPLSPAERMAFMAEPRVAILSVARADRGPLAVPVWYLYAPGGAVRVWTGGAARKTELLLLAGRASLTVQTPAPPYRYVSVEGPIVRVAPAELERDLRPLAQRYLGAQAGERYLAALGGASAGDGDVIIELHPEHWSARDITLGT